MDKSFSQAHRFHVRKGRYTTQHAVTLTLMAEDLPPLLPPTSPRTMTPIKNATGVTNRPRSTKAEVGTEVGMDAVQLAGRWRSVPICCHPAPEPVRKPCQPREGEARPTNPDTKTHVLLQAALLESVYIAATRLRADESVSARLAAFR